MYYLRDIKKCGLTFPRELFHAVQEVLSEEYPDKDFSYFDIYRNYSVYLEDWKSLDTTRGYCLGMANNLVTLCQCVMFEMLKRRVPEDLDLQGFFGNDDSVMSVDSSTTSSLEDLASAIEMADTDILSGLNVMIHPDKTYWSVWPIIFEEYGHENYQKKESRLAMALSSARLAFDIKFAKCVVNALSPLFRGEEYERRILNDIIGHFGYEFFPQERDYSYSLGGWYTHSSDGCDLSLREVDETKDEEIIRCLYVAHESVAKWRSILSQTSKSNKEEGKSFSQLGRTYKVWVKNPDFETVALPYSSINQSIEEFKSFYQGVFDLSRDVFKGFVKAYKAHKTPSIPRGSVSKTDLLLLLFRDNVDYAIPESLVLKQTYVCTLDYVNVKTPNPLLKRHVGLREMIHVGDKHIRIESDRDIDVVGYPQASMMSELPRLAEDQFEVVIDNSDFDLESILQFSTNPNIPLSEFVRKYKYCPLSVIKMADIGIKEQILRLHNIDIKSEQEFRWCLGLLDIMTNEQISEYFESQRGQINMENHDLHTDIQTMVCDDHILSPRAGVDEQLGTSYVISEDCIVCQGYRDLFRSISESQHSLDNENRQVHLSMLVSKKSRLKDLLRSIGHDPQEVYSLQEEEIDIFASNSDGCDSGDGGMFDMFG
jgi:hypothetical protein